ncbi:MAG: trehalose-phosphatase [Solirubrobacterales bacterium]
MSRADSDKDAHERADELLAPLRADPRRSALVLDVDGTLAPIVPTPEQAKVPERTRELLEALAERYGLIACVSGRQVLDARRVVGINSISYSGNHGFEYLAAHSGEIVLDPSVVGQAQRVREFATERFSGDLQRVGVRFEDKESICAFHWRGAPDETGTRARLELIAADARDLGLAVHWGRKVLEIRPDVAIDKGSALESLLRHADPNAALYAGDDTTDLDAFHRLHELRAQGALGHAVCVGVVSDEGPAEIAERADMIVDGPEGMADLLASLR